MIPAAAPRGIDVIRVAHDSGIGAKCRDKRPGLDRMLKDAMRGKFDVVLAWAMDRLGRSLTDLLHTLSELEGAGVALVLHQQAIDTTTPAGRMFFQVTGAFAEFERAMIVTRVRQGLARVKATGRTKSGRPIGRPKVPFATERAIKERLPAGVGQARIARELRCGVGTVRRVALGATR